MDHATPAPPRLIVLHGDETGEELLVEALRLLDPGVIASRVECLHYDLSLESRRATGNGIVTQAAAAIREHGYGLKAATITPEAPDTLRSPNAILREEIRSEVIIRTGRPLPGITALGSISSPITVVRMAVDDAYSAREWRETLGDDEIAYRTEHISRRVCRMVADVAFREADRSGGVVFGGPKYTVSPVYEGMLKEELDDAAARYPAVSYSPQLIDATYALLLRHHGRPLVIPALNRDGDCLSDLVLALYGTIAGAEFFFIVGSGAENGKPVFVAEAPHGTAPALRGKNIANPLGMILAVAAVLKNMPGSVERAAGGAIAEAADSALAAGVSTPDLGGTASTTAFVDEVLDRTRALRTRLS